MMLLPTEDLDNSAIDDPAEELDGKFVLLGVVVMIVSIFIIALSVAARFSKRRRLSAAIKAGEIYARRNDNI
jgi:hypothetical protein